MKIHIFLLIIIFKFSLSNESKLTFQRKLENNKDKQFIIIGLAVIALVKIKKLWDLIYISRGIIILKK